MHLVKQRVASALAKGGAPAAMGIMLVADLLPFCPTQPGAILTGALLGLLAGLPLIMATQALAAVLACWLGRNFTIFRPLQHLAMQLQKRRGYADPLAGCAAQSSFLQELGILVLLRQSPFLPFAVSNYYIGAATKIRPGAVLLGTLLGGLPTNVLYAVIGTSSKAILTSETFDLSLDSFVALVPQRARDAAIMAGVVSTALLVALGVRSLQSEQIFLT